MDDKQTYDAVLRMIRAEIPGFGVKFKSESWTSKLLGVLAWPFNRKYMTNYTTTRYPKVYFPSRVYVTSSYRRAWKILAHEWVHLSDRKHHGPLFNVFYLAPQIFAILALPALLAVWFSNWWMVFALALVFIAPLPAPGRRHFEMRAYTMSMAVNYWRYGYIRPLTRKNIVDQFTGPAYYYMWPSFIGTLQYLDLSITALETNEVMEWYNPEPFKKMKELIASGI